MPHEDPSDQNSILQIHDWVQPRVLIRGSFTDSAPWDIGIDRLVIRWGRIEGASMSRYFCQAIADGLVLAGLRGIRIDIHRGSFLTPRSLQIRMRIDPGDGRVTRAVRWSDRARAKGKEPKYFREDQCMGIRASIVKWLYSVGESPMLV